MNGQHLGQHLGNEVNGRCSICSSRADFLSSRWITTDRREAFYGASDIVF